jgi:lysyl-tRNA synthetase class 2
VADDAMTTRATRAPFLLSLFAALAGVVGLVSTMTPEWSGRLATMQDYFSPVGPRVADGLTVAASFGLLLLARGLARRRHRAWQAAIVLLTVGAVLHVLKGLDVEEAAFYLTVAGLLWWRRADFDAAGDPLGPPRAGRAALGALVGLYLYGMGAIAAHAALRHGPWPGIGGSLRQVTYGLAGQDVHALPGRFDHDLTMSLATAGLVCATYVLWLALRPRDSAPSEATSDRTDARRLVEADGRDSLAYFALRRDKTYFFNAERTAFLAYRAVGGVALVSGDPIGDEDAFDDLLTGFVRFCHEHAWRVAVMGVGDRHRDAWARIGLRSIYVGDEAVVRPDAFSLEGRAIRKVRQSVNRLDRLGYRTVTVPAASLDRQRWREIDRVSHAWLRGQPERGFSMALDDMHAPEHGDAVLTLALDPDDRVAGFIHFVPVPAAGGLSLSAMRRLPDTPNGLMEFLLCRTFAWGREHDVARVSLNFNAFGELLRSDAALPPWQRLVRFGLGKADRFFQVERLLEFNRKFFPDWEPRYAAFERYADVPLGALVSLSVESLVVWPSALRRLWPHPAA